MELGSLQSRLKMLQGVSPQNNNLISRTMKKHAVRVVWAGAGLTSVPSRSGSAAASVFHSASSSGFKEHWEEPSTRSRTLVVVVVVVVGSLPGTEQTSNWTDRLVAVGQTDGRTDGVSLETAPHRPASVCAVPMLL